MDREFTESNCMHVFFGVGGWATAALHSFDRVDLGSWGAFNGFLVMITSLFNDAWKGQKKGGRVERQKERDETR